VVRREGSIVAKEVDSSPSASQHNDTMLLPLRHHLLSIFSQDGRCYSGLFTSIPSQVGRKGRREESR
tara:strand:+ start:360 stop:560 length:201 start_codon:yes stop_codon:yes gene_type:complete